MTGGPDGDLGSCVDGHECMCEDELCEPVCVVEIRVVIRAGSAIIRFQTIAAKTLPRAI